MNGNRIRTGLYNVFEWIVLLAWLNVLWTIFSLIGLVIFGWAPATTALLSVLRQVLREKNLQLPTFKEFYYYYKTNFIKANGVGLILILITLAIGYGFITLPFLPKLPFYIMFIFYLVMTSLFMIMSTFIFPAFTHYQTTFINYFKYALVIGLTHLHYGLLFFISLILMYVLFRAFPGLILFFSISIPCALLMSMALKVFNKIENSISVVK